MKVDSINCSYNKHNLTYKKHNSVGFGAISPKFLQQKPNFANRIKAFISSLFKKEQAIEGSEAKLEKIGSGADKRLSDKLNDFAKRLFKEDENYDKRFIDAAEYRNKS